MVVWEVPCRFRLEEGLQGSEHRIHCEKAGECVAEYNNCPSLAKTKESASFSDIRWNEVVARSYSRTPHATDGFYYHRVGRNSRTTRAWLRYHIRSEGKPN